MQDPTLSTQLSNATDNVVDKVTGWLTQAIAMLPNLVVAILVLVLFVVAAKVVRRVLDRVLSRVSDNAQVRSLLTTVAYVAVIAIGTFVALGVLELDKTVTSLLAGVGILGLALGFAFQDIASNFVSGVLLAFRRPFREGDLIESNDLFGKVESINLRSTLIRKPTGQIVYMPNQDVFTNPIINYSRLGERRVDVAVGVSYDDDLEKARRVTIEALEGLEMRYADRPVEVFYNEFGGSSINFVARFWIAFSDKQPEFLHAQSEAIIAIKKAFDANGISIPFPIRTLDLGDNLKPFKEVFAARGNGATGVEAN